MTGSWKQMEILRKLSKMCQTYGWETFLWSLLVLQYIGYLFLEDKGENATESIYFHLEVRLFFHFRSWFLTPKYTDDWQMWRRLQWLHETGKLKTYVISLENEIFESRSSCFTLSFVHSFQQQPKILVQYIVFEHLNFYLSFSVWQLMSRYDISSYR